eukprot:TRINITY_DN39550_c0_g1_i1.p1 TRINITY_DN39550_c0_g1~~TRINITY_DN39550_c0_g1_i1.p1  ORF type:complete len:452 (+),score=121.44 TRINITY_DN39550_c0_g1_i1:60-1415(+)
MRPVIRRMAWMLPEEIKAMKAEELQKKPVARTVMNNAISEAALMERRGECDFMTACRRVFVEIQAEDYDYARDPLRINPAGGVLEITNKDSQYRRCVRRQDRLFLPSLCFMLGGLILNTFHLVVPNSVVLSELWSKQELPEEVIDWCSLLLAVYEILGLCMLTWRLTRSCITSCRSTGFPSWYQTTQVWWKWLPFMARFSGIHSLGLVHPKILLNDLQVQFEKHHSKHDKDITKLFKEGDISRDMTAISEVLREKRTCSGLRFLLVRFLIAIFGLVAFRVKVNQVNTRIEEPSIDWWESAQKAVVLVAFVNQCLNTVDLGNCMKKETLRVIFAGEDACFDRREMIFEAVFHANVAEKIWEAFRAEKGLLYTMAALMSFTNEDVQRCAIGVVDKDDLVEMREELDDPDIQADFEPPRAPSVVDNVGDVAEMAGDVAGDIGHTIFAVEEGPMT